MRGGRLDVAVALRSPAFRWYALCRFVSGTGLTLLRATLLWQVYAITGEKKSVAFLGLILFAPSLGVGLIAGAVADSREPKRITQIAQICGAIGSLVLAFLTYGGHADLGVTLTMALVIGVAQSFETPARIALLPRVVPGDVFPSAVVVNSKLQTVAFVTGPFLAGYTIHLFGVVGACLLHAALMTVAMLTLAFVPSAKRETPGAGVRLGAIWEGLRYVFRNPVVLGCMTLDMFAVIFGGAVALLPVFAQDILKVGADGYGFLSAATEVGAVAMAALLLMLPPIRRVGVWLLVAVAGYSLATIAFGFSESFTFALVMLALVGMTDYVSVMLRSVIVQLSVTDELRGRVSSVNSIFIGASNSLGVVEAGFVAELTSTRFSVVSGGVGALLVVIIVAMVVPTLRRYQR